MRMNFLLVLAAAASLLSLSQCTSVPKNINNVCSVFDSDSDWYDEAKEASEKWGTSIPVMMAIMRRESGFIDDARPPRRWYLGFIPGSRPSSAYGYAQALDGTWSDYKKSTGRWFADRDDFDDAIDFIGWYLNVSQRKLGIKQRDAYRHYLAYHEGWGGYRSGSYNSKPALKTWAKQVQTTASRYTMQLNRCRGQLES